MFASEAERTAAEKEAKRLAAEFHGLCAATSRPMRGDVLHVAAPSTKFELRVRVMSGLTFDFDSDPRAPVNEVVLSIQELLALDERPRVLCSDGRALRPAALLDQHRHRLRAGTRRTLAARGRAGAARGLLLVRRRRPARWWRARVCSVARRARELGLDRGDAWR